MGGITMDLILGIVKTFIVSIFLPAFYFLFKRQDTYMKANDKRMEDIYTKAETIEQFTLRMEPFIIKMENSDKLTEENTNELRKLNTSLQSAEIKFATRGNKR